MGTTPSTPSESDTSSAPEGACPLGFDKYGRDPAKRESSDAKPAAAVEPAVAAGTGSSHPLPRSSSSSTCPVRQGRMPKADDKGERASAARGSETPSTVTEGRAEESKCPVKVAGNVTKYLSPHSYDVYGRRKPRDEALDPTNNMPVNPNQLPAPDQKRPLSTERVPSTIPKGGEDTTWTYPSPQMFWNSLRRKGKIEDTDEADIDMVVAIHNNMNENTWKEILKWEEIRRDSREVLQAEPRLLRFVGRPDEISPKAVLKMCVGHPLPFDRHDWIVDRGGKERRYIIDYFHDEGLSSEDQAPELHSKDAVKSIKIDVRPALDDASCVIDRVFRMPVARRIGASDFDPLPFFPPASLRNVRRSRQWKNAAGNGNIEMTESEKSNKEDLKWLPHFVAAGFKARAATRSMNPPKDVVQMQIKEDPRREQEEIKEQMQQHQREALRQQRRERKNKKRKEQGHPRKSRSTPDDGKPVDPKDEAELRKVLARIKKKCAKRLQALQDATAGLDHGSQDSRTRAEALSLGLEHCTARVVCKKEARAYRGAVGYLSVMAAHKEADTYFAERALDRRIDNMRGCLNDFTERQVVSRRRWKEEAAARKQIGEEGAGGAQEGEGKDEK